ncbi:MAG: RNA methyltransferase [Treponema sp.]|jgi:TrmH RNA methyltransferase|nr:RNA methyltransferase [Treponema sp.]
MRNRLTDELAVCGLNAVKALGEYHPERINRLFLREEQLRVFSQICRKLAEWKRPYKICEDEELERLCKSSRHQGVVAMMLQPEVEGADEEDLDTWAAGKTGLILHNIGNDHNVGAIIRSAAFFDVSYAVISESERESLLTTSAYRVAEGGMEHVCFRQVQSTAAFLKAASKRIITIGTDIRARQRIGDLPLILTEEAKKSKYGGKTGAKQAQGSRPGIALVLGNEETGLSEEIRSLCSILVRVPGTGLVESLNVAQAAALFMYSLYEFS